MKEKRSYVFVKDVIVDTRKAMQNLFEGFHVFLTSEELEIGFLVNVPSRNAPPDNLILATRPVHVRLRIDGKDASRIVMGQFFLEAGCLEAQLVVIPRDL